MAKAILIVESNPADTGAESQYNEWYERTHIPEIIAKVPGITGAKRYTLSSVTPGSSYRYLAVYDVEAADPSSVVHTMMALMTDGALTMSPALQADPAPVVRLYDQL